MPFPLYGTASMQNALGCVLLLCTGMLLQKSAWPPHTQQKPWHRRLHKYHVQEKPALLPLLATSGLHCCPSCLVLTAGPKPGAQSHETSPKSASVQGCVPIGALKEQKHGAELMPHSLTGNPVLLQPNCVINETQTSLHQNPRSLLRAAALMASLPFDRNASKKAS